ncbi:organic cation transporter protein-like [Oppia nitens]|uniref:organic cation transporter protein-like n=1 Tax=Oppia nitens TaxID=1686743 RepID=UPI0023DCC39C|nr:organic cation transporter protein-like [Oppia nitens]
MNLPNKPTRVQHVTDIIGEWGLWQLNVVMFSVSCAMFLGFHTLSVSFYAPTINYWCSDNNNNNDTGADNIGSNNKTLFKSNDYYCLNGCQNWTFDKSVFKSTIIDEWHLICDRRELSSLTQSLLMLGYALGAIGCGYLSGRFGRKPVLWLTILLEIMAGLSSALSVNIIHFSLSRLVLGMATYGRALTAFILVTECFGPKYRATVSLSIHFGWALGYCLLPGIAYLLPNFRQMIFATSIPEILWVVWLYWIPESPRWLIANRQWYRLEPVLKQAVHMNSLPLSDFQWQFQSLKTSYIVANDKQQNINSNDNTKSFIWEVLKSPNLSRTTLIMYFTWFVNALVYYGISLNIGEFGYNLFINFFIAGLLEVPATLVPIVAINYMGRRPLTAGLMYASGLSCLAIVPLLMMSADWPRVTIALIGKFFITSSYAVIYAYGAEVYPTVIRQAGLGSCSVASSVGSILAPFVKDMSLSTGMNVVLYILSGLSIVDAVSVHFLPETSGQQIADTVAEAEQINKY